MDNDLNTLVAWTAAAEWETGQKSDPPISGGTTMKEYDDATYGDRIAGVYDALYPGFEEAAIDLLHELAGRGRALELGIGTGRVALPLAGRGVEITGIDTSPAMITALQAKPGASGIEVVQGSFAQFEMEDRFNLAYVAFNTFFALQTQEEQVACFQSVARHLTTGGVFLIEAFVPDPGRFDRDQTVQVVGISEDVVNLDVALHDSVRQQVRSQHVVLSEKGLHLYPVKLRYAWPSELDLMARLAGLKLVHSWGSWDRSEFTAESGKHISVYGAAI